LGDGADVGEGVEAADVLRRVPVGGGQGDGGLVGRLLPRIVAAGGRRAPWV